VTQCTAHTHSQQTIVVMHNAHCIHAQQFRQHQIIKLSKSAATLSRTEHKNLRFEHKNKDKDLWSEDKDKDLQIGPQGQGLSSRITTLAYSEE